MHISNSPSVHHNMLEETLSWEEFLNPDIHIPIPMVLIMIMQSQSTSHIAYSDHDNMITVIVEVLLLVMVMALNSQFTVMTRSALWCQTHSITCNIWNDIIFLSYPSLVVKMNAWGRQQRSASSQQQQIIPWGGNRLRNIFWGGSS